MTTRCGGKVNMSQIKNIKKTDAKPSANELA